MKTLIVVVWLSNKNIHLGSPSVGNLNAKTTGPVKPLEDL